MAVDHADSQEDESKTAATRGYVGRVKRKLAGGADVGQILLWLESEGLATDDAQRIVHLAKLPRERGRGGALTMLGSGIMLGCLGLGVLAQAAQTGDQGGEGSIAAVVMITVGICLAFLGFKGLFRSRRSS